MPVMNFPPCILVQIISRDRSGHRIRHFFGDVETPKSVAGFRLIPCILRTSGRKDRRLGMGTLVLGVYILLAGLEITARF